MNRVVVLGAIIVAVVVAIIAVGILSANHQNNNYTPTSTTTNNGTSIILNTNTTTPSTTTTTTPTNTTSNVTTNIPYNTFYFLNKTNSSYYYIFVLSYNEYEQMVRGYPGPITFLLLNITEPVTITKNVVVGNYVFLIGHTNLINVPLNVTIGHQYPIGFETNTGYLYQFTYEGNWTGPVP